MLVLTSAGAMGQGTGTITVTGNALRGMNLAAALPAYGGGTLVLGNLGTFSRNLSLSGGGPVGDEAALFAVGNNTLSGAVSTYWSFTANNAGARIAGSLAGLTTFSGSLIVGTTPLQLTGDGNFLLSGTVSVAGGTAGVFAGSGGVNVPIIDKVGLGTLSFAGAAMDSFAGQLYLTGGTIRLTAGAQMGTNPNGLRVANNWASGTLEFRSDAAGANFAANNLGGANVSSGGTTGTTFFLDRAIGGSNIGNTGAVNLAGGNVVTLGQYAQGASSTGTFTLSGRDGIGLAFTSGSGLGTYWLRNQ